MSGSSLQANGASYGHGIYCSDSYQVSNGYCKDNGQKIVGVYEVSNDINKFKKGPNIYVLPSNDICILRYLIVGNANTDSNYLNGLFMTTIKKENVESKVNILNKGNNKLIKEYQAIVQEGNYHIELIDNNMREWNVKIKGINLKVIFPELYPFEPPFIYIEGPILKETKYITIDGAICLEYLTPSHWQPVISIKSLLLQIEFMILPNTCIKKEGSYDFSKAKDSYKTLALGNGWI
jgi:ubiquitin-protein ligase